MAKQQKAQKKEPVRVAEAPKPKQIKKPAVPRKRDPKKTPTYVVLDKRGEPMLHGATFVEFRLARRAAQRSKNQGGHPTEIKNTRTGQTHPFVPFPPKLESKLDEARTAQAAEPVYMVV